MAEVFAKSQLKALVERIERLEEEKKALADDIREVYGEAKANGFDTKALRAVIRLRAQEPAERQEFEAIIELYRDALGLTPLEQIAARGNDKLPDVPASPREPHPSVAAPPFAHTSPAPGADMPDIPPALRREPEQEQPRMAAAE